MNLHWVAIALLIISGIFWLTAVITINEFFVKNTHRPQIHHWYFGALLVIVGGNWIYWIVGLWFCLDDTVQHVTQETEPYYLSPLHKLNDSIYMLLPKSLQHILDKV